LAFSVASSGAPSGPFTWASDQRRGYAEKLAGNEALLERVQHAASNAS
jgi:hypothetical protein